MSPQTDTNEPVLLHTDFPALPPPRRGKVRDIYDFGQTLLIVATDRISVFESCCQPASPARGKFSPNSPASGSSAHRGSSAIIS